MAEGNGETVVLTDSVVVDSEVTTGRVVDGPREAEVVEGGRDAVESSGIELAVKIGL